MVVHSCTDMNTQAGAAKIQLKVNVILERAKIKNTYYLFSTIT